VIPDLDKVLDNEIDKPTHGKIFLALLEIAYMILRKLDENHWRKINIY
jgi:hypothetical protein